MPGSNSSHPHLPRSTPFHPNVLLELRHLQCIGNCNLFDHEWKATHDRGFPIVWLLDGRLTKDPELVVVKASPSSENDTPTAAAANQAGEGKDVAALSIKEGGESKKQKKNKEQRIKVRVASHTCTTIFTLSGLCGLLSTAAGVFCVHGALPAF
jgi:hypothetical protein